MNDLVPVSDRSGIIVPVTDVKSALVRYQSMKEFIAGVLKQDVDYGVIPGALKPSLLKPGAEKLAFYFGLKPRFVMVKDIENWEGNPPLFYYHYKCILERNGEPVGEGEGSCNSREKKYRWRNSERVCPVCNAPAIKRSKFDDKGWYCYDKLGGCGAKFKADDPAIANQTLGQIENPEIFDLVNTMQKMAQKRAFIAAVLIAANASDYFTQDIEDFVQGEFHETTNNSAPATTGKAQATTSAAKPRPGAAAKPPAKEKLSRPIPADQLAGLIAKRAETMTDEKPDPQAAEKIMTALSSALMQNGVQDIHAHHDFLNLLTGANDASDLTDPGKASVLAWLAPDDKWLPSEFAVQEVGAFWAMYGMPD